MPASSRNSPQTSRKAKDKHITKWHRHKRGFKELPLHPVGHQSGRDRFPRRDPINDAPLWIPKINQWRNNLTALSQLYNLYFVACLDCLYVYQPSFPDQSLKFPLSRWRLPVSKPGLRGDMPPAGIYHSSHSVNNMLVSNLGNMEVLVCACDDGDMLVYGTEMFLKSRAPRALFHSNVGRSAWGLAVHQEARLIAVSANSHEITVFAPALVANTSPQPENSTPQVTQSPPSYLTRRSSDWNLLRNAGDREGQESASEVHDLSESALTHYRHFNLKIHLKRHTTNIPSISFCNSTDDSAGRFLASTDISGVTIIWDVHKGEAIRVVRPTVTMDLEMMPHGSRNGWGVMFLDRKCFAPTKSVVQAMGMCHKVSLWLRSNQPLPSIAVYDISQSLSKVPKSSSHWQPGWSPQDHPADSVPSPLAAANTIMDDIFMDLFMNMGSDDDDEHVDDESSDMESFAENSNFLPKSDRRPSSARDRDIFSENKQGCIYEDRVGPDIDMNTLVDHKCTMFTHNVERPLLHSELPQSPLLLLNPHKVHLFQSGCMDWLNEHDADHPPSPVIMLNEPLEQSVPSSIRRALEHCDRLNLYAQIPELGVVLLGSPKGRVAVLSLHLLEPDREPGTGHHRTDVHQSMFTMRLDYTLPLAHEETEGLRPLQPLVGLAAGPIHCDQSREKARYRIMLMYLDHTVLSYEVGREGSDDYHEVKIF